MPKRLFRSDGKTRKKWQNSVRLPEERKRRGSRERATLQYKVSSARNYASNCSNKLKWGASEAAAMKSKMNRKSAKIYRISQWALDWVQGYTHLTDLRRRGIINHQLGCLDRRRKEVVCVGGCKHISIDKAAAGCDSWLNSVWERETSPVREERDNVFLSSPAGGGGNVVNVSSPFVYPTTARTTTATTTRVQRGRPGSVR